jgi:DnaJ like chaperone protein
MWLGRVIGVLMGAAMMGWFGAVLGFFLGRWFDRGLSGAGVRPTQQQHGQAQQVFLDTLLRLMGHLAKADGRISAQEIEQSEQLMEQLGLRDERRRQAIILFKEGSSPGFSLDDTMIRFLSTCGRYHQLHQLLLEYLFHVAFADDILQPSERAVLVAVATWLGLSEVGFERLLRMYQAQYQFAQGRTVVRTEQARLQDAYVALGISPQASDREVKSAYRKLMSKHHPDKLIAQGVPPDMLKVATEKAQEITSAHELIIKYRAQ